MSAAWHDRITVSAERVLRGLLRVCQSPVVLTVRSCGCRVHVDLWPLRRLLRCRLLLRGVCDVPRVFG